MSAEWWITQFLIAYVAIGGGVIGYLIGTYKEKRRALKSSGL